MWKKNAIRNQHEIQMVPVDQLVKVKISGLTEKTVKTLHEQVSLFLGEEEMGKDNVKLLKEEYERAINDKKEALDKVFEHRIENLKRELGRACRESSELTEEQKENLRNALEGG